MDAQATDVPAWSVREVFRKWEFLRLIYNGVLIAEAVFFLVPLVGHVRMGPLLFRAAGAAIVVNACFFLGPVVESYASWLGWRPRWLRWVLFGMGLLATMLVVALIMLWIHVGVSIPDQD